ncbi:SymE family type I addiction module toxin [Pantoea stewartii]|uniref:SymE family type I addiction module toxin n=2 Tax=Pantoea stewartii TaxID=66269 RepID=UPI001F043111|nr:SymE family type I addiction module toxin [Pantoea stewartii]
MMAETHHKPAAATSIPRCDTVGYVSDAKYQQLPSITLKCHWLEEVGLGQGLRLTSG